MTSDQVTRQEHLQRLYPFCQALAKALARAGVVPKNSLEAWREAVAAQCVQCGIEVSGQELFALSQAPSPELDSAKIGRLRMGDCARKGCTSYYYRLVFRPYQELNWPEILAQVETITQEPAQKTRSQSTSSHLELSSLWRLPVTRRLGAVFVLIVVLLLVRQWSIGGRIPWLHEPEKFLAAPDSTAASVPH
jgi:hypothetical protein